MTYIALLMLLFSGCAYSSRTVIKASGDELAFPIGGISTVKGKNVKMEFTRETNPNGDDRCLDYVDVKLLCGDPSWE